VSKLHHSRHQPCQPSPEKGDEQLALLISEKDEKAFPELVSRFQGPLYTYLYRCGVPRSDRHDLFLKVFARALTAAHSLHKDDSLRLWLLTIAARVVREHQSRQQLRTPPLLRRLLGRPVIETDEEERSPLEEAIVRLPLVKRQIVLLCSCERLSIKQVAEALQIPIKRVRRHLDQARVALATAMARDRRSAAS
jgi:RNA polymerase sigma-70 factor (ECF subfamily)